MLQPFVFWVGVWLKIQSIFLEPLCDMVVTLPVVFGFSSLFSEYDRLDVEPSDDAEVNIDLDAWVVDVSGGDTPDDYTDDSYSISGGGEYIGVVSSSTSSSANVMQLGLARLLMSRDCSLNPTEGFAFINEVAASTGDQGSMPVVASALLEFDSTCDGTVQVMVATGNYIASNGDSVPMDLDR